MRKYNNLGLKAGSSNKKLSDMVAFKRFLQAWKISCPSKAKNAKCAQHEPQLSQFCTILEIDNREDYDQI